MCSIFVWIVIKMQWLPLILNGKSTDKALFCLYEEIFLLFVYIYLFVLKFQFSFVIWHLNFTKKWEIMSETNKRAPFHLYFVLNLILLKKTFFVRIVSQNQYCESYCIVSWVNHYMPSIEQYNQSHTFLLSFVFHAFIKVTNDKKTPLIHLIPSLSKWYI